MEEFFSKIGSARLFAGMDESEIKKLLGCLEARWESFPKGACILKAGDHVESIGLLLQGSALVIQEDFWGSRNILRSLEPGQCFGEAFACAPGSVLNVSVETQTKAAAMFLNVRRLLAMCPFACEYHSRIIRNLLADVAAGSLLFNEKVIHLSQRTTRRKLLSYLSWEARRQGSSEFTIPFSRQQLADYLSVDRSGLSLELGRLQQEGRLEVDRNHFILKAVMEI